MSPSKAGNQIRILSYYAPQAEYLREALDDLLRKKEYQAILRKAAK